MNFQERYGPMDRFLHRTAFGVLNAQQALADLEEILYGDRLSSIPVQNPVFISGLPRAGTTILLKILCRSGRFASHTYRDMPFVLCPLFWNRFSGLFLRDDRARPRAHGDGLKVSSRSPEAFEEMIWKHFWPDHYRTDRILPWEPGETNPEFDRFFETHMRKVIAVRGEDTGENRRYVSKNNLNIARLASRPGPLDEGTFLIPFRAPLQQAASLLRQHRRFQRIHRDDDFVRVYMEAIGHHEFGKALRPVDFDGWLPAATGADELEHWLQYWVVAYRSVLKHSDEGTVLIPYDRLTTDPEPFLKRIAQAIEVPPDALVSQSDSVRLPRSHDVDVDRLPDELLDRARETFEALSGESMVSQRTAVKT